MGSVSRFDLGKMCEQHGLKHFVETGTGQGNSLGYAALFPFKSLFSCEIEPTLHASAKTMFAGDSRVRIMLGDSLTFLTATCDTLPVDEPALFWLDAHFPGADYGLRGYGAEKNQVVRLPLRQELNVLRLGRPARRDVVLIDDVRIYADGPYQNGNLPNELRDFGPYDRSDAAEFMKYAMADTHDTKILYADEGYAIITPR